MLEKLNQLTASHGELLPGHGLLGTHLVVHTLFGWTASDGVQASVCDLPLPVALFLILLVADLVQYATHRAYHGVPSCYLVVTPNFHHWHHSQDDAAIDKNYAAHFAFIDHLFGTAVHSDRAWPARHGVVGDHVPSGFWQQVRFPFVWRPGP